MSISDYWERLKHRPSRPDSYWTDIPSDLPSGETGPDLSGYFHVRLSEMVLSDERRFQQEIVPATFFLSDYLYAGETRSQPFFVSNKLLSALPEGVGSRSLRVTFRDTMVVRTTPYAGGDVTLFVALFSSAIKDYRAAAFNVFEKLFGTFDLGGMSQYLKVADKLSEELMALLGSENLECRLARQMAIGKGRIPSSGHHAFLRSRDGKPVDTSNLTIRNGTLLRSTNGQTGPVDDADYCLIQVEQSDTRNDYATMPFHRTWQVAREKMLAQHVQEAQSLMLQCSQDILASPDLTEDHKFKLIQLYQSKLLAMPTLVALQRAPTEATREGSSSIIRNIQARALQSSKFRERDLVGPFDEMSRMTLEFSQETAGRQADFSEDEIEQHMRRPLKAASTPRLLVQALAAGSLQL